MSVRLIAVLFTVINALVLLLFITTLHKLFTTGKSDINGTLTLLITIFGILPLWRISQYILPATIKNATIDKNRVKTLFIAGNTVFIAVTIILTLLLPVFSEIWFKAGEKAHNKNHVSQAINYYERALYQQPGRSDIYFSLGNLYESTAKYKLAQEHYWLAIKNNKAPFAAYNNLARLYLKEAKYDDALDLLSLALTFNEENKESATQPYKEREGIIYKNIAWAYLELEEYEIALKNIQYSFDALYSGGVLEKYPIIHCIVAIVAKELEKHDDVYNAQQVCSGGAENYRGLERALERKARIRGTP